VLPALLLLLLLCARTHARPVDFVSPEADRAARVHVRVEQRWDELALGGLKAHQEGRRIHVHGVGVRAKSENDMKENALI